jgi:hypothetical protein
LRPLASGLAWLRRGLRSLEAGSVDPTGEDAERRQLLEGDLGLRFAGVV